MIARDWKPGRVSVPREEPLRIPDLIFKSTAFLVGLAAELQSETQYDLESSGFFFGVKSRLCPPYSFFYFVTTKHSIPAVQPAVRLTLKNGDSAIAPLGRMFTHPTDPYADVAVFEFEHKPEYDILYLSDEDAKTKAMMAGLDIGVGDEVYYPGLFTLTQDERNKNQPILRHGNIAMLPQGKVPTETGMMDAYLVEARSIGGISGSAVFVRRTASILWNFNPETARKDGIESLHGLTGEVHLIGMMHGHWDIKESEINQARSRYANNGVNMGVGIVIPINKILETINQPDAARLRDAEEQSYFRQIIPCLD
jgi:hypothetical protein